MPAASPPLVVVVMGVSGCGKSTVGGLLAGRLGWALQEGDDLHPPANVAKMAAGDPLTDEDRGPWLDRVAAWIFDHLARGEPGVITCSALKRSYRDRLLERVGQRPGHFMPGSLLDSQLATLEPLERDEQGIVVGPSDAGGPSAG